MAKPHVHASAVLLLGSGLLAMHSDARSPVPPQAGPACVDAAVGCTKSGSDQVAALVLAARVWGLVKYHHPVVTRCGVDWDRALLDLWPQIEAADPAAPDAAIAALLARAGDVPRRSPDAGTPPWITDAPVAASLREQLAWIAAQSPERQCYVSAQHYFPARFDLDAAYSSVFEPDRAHRALGALRYWNAIEYFFPYRDLIGRDWADVLAEHLPWVLDAAPGLPHATAMRRFASGINDSHGFFRHPRGAAELGAGAPPLRLREVEGRQVVTYPLPLESPVRPGDALVAIDAEDFHARIARIGQDAGHGSNPAYRSQEVVRLALHGSAQPAVVRMRRPDGSEYETALPRGHDFAGWPVLTPDWEIRQLPQCRMGVVDIVRVAPERVAAMMSELEHTDALVIDVRGYPRGTILALIDHLYDAPRVAARLDAPDLRKPGTYYTYDWVISGRATRPYRGRLLLLQDESTISQAEFTLMLLQAGGNAITFGSQTAAGDGEITEVSAPGLLAMSFTGLAVKYPDGRQTQRIGIVPDVHVMPSIAGLAAGRDEVMDAALDCRWLHETPPRRLPQPGYYYDPARSGEGIDIHRDASGNIAVLSFGYDAQGEPEWMLAAGAQHGDDWQRGFHRYRGGEAGQLQAGFSLDFHAGPYAPACAISDQSRLHPRALWRWPSAGGSGERCVQPLLLTGTGAVSGVWATQESGWGVSVHHHAGKAVAIVYAYDAAGEPRWLLGTDFDWDGSGPLEVELQRARSSCRDCPYQAPVFEPAGRLRLVFDGVRGGDPDDNRLSIDAAIGPGQRWVRDNVRMDRITGDPSG